MKIESYIFNFLVINSETLEQYTTNLDNVLEFLNKDTLLWIYFKDNKDIARKAYIEYREKLLSKWL